MSFKLNPRLLTLLTLSLLPVQAFCADAQARNLADDRFLVADAPDSLSNFLDKLNAEKKAQAPPSAPTKGTPNADAPSPSQAAKSPAPNDAISPENLKRLNSLESQYFFQQYPNDPIEVRLSRLEKFVFGEVSKGPLEERLTTLEQSLAVRDPNTGKPIIVQPVPKAPPTDGQNGTVPPVVTAPNSDPSSASASGSAPPTLLYPDAIDPSPKQPSSALTNPTSTGAQPSSETIDAALALHIGKSHFASGTTPELLIHQLNVAIQDSSSPGNLFFQRAKAYIQISKWDAALNDLSNAINDIPNNAEFYLARALVQHQLGNGVLAGEDLKQARFYNPKLPKKIDFDDPGIATAK